jgi:hypothetical protein
VRACQQVSEHADEPIEPGVLIDVIAGLAARAAEERGLG